MTAIWRIFYRCYCLMSRLKRWERRRFTRAGLMVLGGLIATGMTGLDTENTVAYQAVIPLMLLLAVAAAFSWFFRARFSATRLLPRFGTVGRPLNYRLVVQNLTRKSQRGLTALEDLVDLRPSLHEWMAAWRAAQKRVRSFRVSRPQRAFSVKHATARETPVPPVPPLQDTEVNLQLTPLRRGVLRFAGVTLARPDPFGLFRAFVTMSVPQSVLILPKRYPLPPLALPGTLEYQEGGVALASSVGRSDEFVALRDYRPGDPVRHIHWRSWAKAGKPVVKEFEDEFFVRHALVLDTFAEEAQEEMFEEAVSVAASFACAIPTQESLLDLLFVGPQSYCFTAGRGLAHTDQMLEILASVRACGHQPFQALEHLVLSHVSLVSGCICVLVAWDEQRRQFIAKLKRLGVPVLVLVVVAPGEDQELDPGPMRTEPGRFHVLEAGRIEEGLARLK
ncbi:MAG: DUF58 domain-containing protein [Verrucomicrobia bacterium]|nr:MAG: DUF58 domain-containing protein [Verrucomicrobiota bacterium]